MSLNARRVRAALSGALIGLLAVWLGVAAPATAQSADPPVESDAASEAEEAAPEAPPTPACAEGREISELSQGRCCWPGQGWSEQYGRCSGPPRCPAHLVAEGDDCIGRLAPPVQPPVNPGVPPVGSVPPVTATGAHPPVSWPTFEETRPTGGLHPRLRSAPDEGWMIFGGVAFGFGWGFSILVGSVVGLASNHCEDLGGYAFIPLVGGLVHGATYEGCADRRDSAVLWGPYIPGAAAQLGGLLAILIALIADDAEAVELESLTFSVPGADVGIGTRVDF